MSKAERTRELYIYVNNLLGIDIADKKRTTEYAEGRALFYALCLKYTNLSKISIGEYVGKNHCAVIHAMDHTINTLTDHRVISAYDDFNTVNYSAPKDDRVVNMLKQLTKEQYEIALVRIEAMVNMISKQKTQKIQVKEMEGAIL